MSDKKQRQAAADLAALRLRIADIMSGACGEDVDQEGYCVNVAQLTDVVQALGNRLYPQGHPGLWMQWNFMDHYETVDQLADFLWDQGLRADGTIVKEES